jgi:hypothetical protein
MKKKKPEGVTRRNGFKRNISVCKCGHIGDGPFTAHLDTELEKGHGKCQIDGCKCKHFVWSEFV